MKISKLALFAILISVAALADTGFLDRSITIKGHAYPFQVYVPPNYSSTTLWPVVVYLHGNGHQGNDGLRQTVAAFADSIREKRSLFPAIVIFPQAPVGAAWFYLEMQDLVMAELDQTIAEFHGDPSRIYLTGFSMGATGAYRIAYHRPHKFAALVAIAGRIEPGSAYTAEAVKVDRETNPFVGTPDPFTSLALQIKNLPIWIFHGDNDEAVPVEQSRRLVAALKKAGATVTYTEYPGVNHVEAAQKAYADTDMIAWFFAQRQPMSPP